jgi:outer membrane protein
MKRTRDQGLLGILAAAALAAGPAAGCSSFPPQRAVDDAVAPAPGRPWQPPPQARVTPTPTPTPAIPAEYLQPGTMLSLPQVVDLALRNNPLTKAAWYQARAAAAELGTKRAEWYPSFELDGNVTRGKQTAIGGRFTTLLTTYGPSLTMNYLLLDFGGRSADVEEAERGLFAAAWSHNAVIQDVVLLVEQQYYAYLNAKAQTAAAESSLKQARESLAAADERHRVGVATIADVLQAKTAASQAELTLESAQGQIQTIRGSLATALGVPANIPVEVGELPENVDVDRARDTVDELIAKAERERPLLAAARFAALKAQAHVASVRSEGLPTLSATGNINRTYFYNNAPNAPYANNYTGSLLFHFPIFTGFANTYDTLKAKEEAKAAEEQAEVVNDQVVLQVWTSYYNLQTASKRVTTAKDFLASATQSQDVALGRYKTGVGSILDLLTAQSAYASARAQEAQARSDWFLAMAQLAHDTGALAPPAPGGNEGNR